MFSISGMEKGKHMEPTTKTFTDHIADIQTECFNDSGTSHCNVSLCMTICSEQQQDVIFIIEMN
jgi:hypothetical protein